MKTIKSKTNSSVFKWTGWLDPATVNGSKKIRYHVIGFNANGFKEWDINKQGKKVKCTCRSYNSEEEYLEALNKRMN